METVGLKITFIHIFINKIIDQSNCNRGTIHINTYKDVAASLQ